MIKVSLSNNKIALIDDSDWNLISNYIWHAKKRNRPGNHHTFYAITHIYNGKWIRTTISMHRLIMGDPKGFQIDHKNGNGLDNQRKNLRPATQEQNSMNRRSCYNSTSKFKGVSWKTENKKWHATITINKVKTHIGYYDDEVKAAISYNEMASKHFGEFAKLNIIPERNHS